MFLGDDAACGELDILKDKILFGNDVAAVLDDCCENDFTCSSCFRVLVLLKIHSFGVGNSPENHKIKVYLHLQLHYTNHLPSGYRNYIERLLDVQKTSWMSSERLMYDQTGPCVQGVEI